MTWTLPSPLVLVWLQVGVIPEAEYITRKGGLFSVVLAQQPALMASEWPTEASESHFCFPWANWSVFPRLLWTILRSTEASSLQAWHDPKSLTTWIRTNQQRMSTNKKIGTALPWCHWPASNVWSVSRWRERIKGLHYALWWLTDLHMQEGRNGPFYITSLSWGGGERGEFYSTTWKLNTLTKKKPLSPINSSIDEVLFSLRQVYSLSCPPHLRKPLYILYGQWPSILIQKKLKLIS